ncbi:hypothetical protein MLD38_022747 [Melastoma candidum]|uniref:Uncharacterized protein n=1 Tax=Melastoma candidum TaxID=119954 RepID=A0ACB9QNP8_9MYRT|nr:hypothetical protein MLD38_022747 [Melastoma candidum]
MNYFPDEVIEHVFHFVNSNKDRNSISLVCKLWYRIERFSRSSVLVGNCYAISPERVIARFPCLKSLFLKGKPHFADFNLVPEDWGGYVYPWIKCLEKNRSKLEELRLKRMIVTDDSLELIAKSFSNFKSLVLVSCERFTTDGLAAIAANCRYLRELDLQENEIEDHRGQWLNCFSECCTSLVALNFACLKGDINLAALERLVARSPNLKSLKLNRTVPVETLHRILVQAPQLVDIGVGSFVCDPESETFFKLTALLQKRQSVRSLSGFFEMTLYSVPAIYPVFPNLISLNLSYAPAFPGEELIKILQLCRKLQKLWVLNCIGDKGLKIVAHSCKELQELRVFPSGDGDGNATVTEEGLVAISSGCPKLNSLLYFCEQMTNAALITVARNCPNFIRFRLCILDPTKPDATTLKPLDEGFGAIVQACKGLRRLSISGRLTDQVFQYIGMHAKNLEMLSVAFAGDSDKGMLHVLNGCEKLNKLEIWNCPYGDGALLNNVRKYETMRSLWMSSCNVSMGGCRMLAKSMPQLNVEVINEYGFLNRDGDDGQLVDKLFVYRTLVGPRMDAPDFVWTL